MSRFWESGVDSEGVVSISAASCVRWARGRFVERATRVSRSSSILSVVLLVGLVVVVGLLEPGDEGLCRDEKRGANFGRERLRNVHGGVVAHLPFL